MEMTLENNVIQNTSELTKTAKLHWEQVYSTKQTNEVSWFQEHAMISMQLIQQLDLAFNSRIIDVGGGASVFVDDLLIAGFHNLTVLDISQQALLSSQQRLDQKAKAITWIAKNILDCNFLEKFDVWHDRAVFHFLTEAQDQQRYIEKAVQSLNAGAYLVMAVFAEDGPLKCSGLEIQRYSVKELQQLIESKGFLLKQSLKHEHVTPAGVTQKFNYCVFVKTV